MKRRERYSMEITCPRCGKSGRVVWAESQPTRSSASLACAPKLVFSGFHTGPGTNKTGRLLSASGVVRLDHATRPATRAPSRALPRRRAL